MHKLFSVPLTTLRKTLKGAKSAPDFCTQKEREVTAFFDGELHIEEAEGAAKAERIRRHLSECPVCSRCVQEWRELQRSLTLLSASTPEPPPGFAAKVLSYCYNDGQPELHALLTDYLESAEMDATTRGTLSTLLTAPSPPPGFAEQIIQATSMQETEISVVPQAAVTEKLKNRFSFRTIAVPRWSVAFAFPVLALGVMIMVTSGTLPSLQLFTTPQETALSEGKTLPMEPTESSLEPAVGRSVDSALSTPKSSALEEAQTPVPEVLLENSSPKKPQEESTEKTVEQPSAFAVAATTSASNATALPKERRQRTIRRKRSEYNTSSGVSSKYFRSQNRRNSSSASADLVIAKNGSFRGMQPSQASGAMAVREIRPLPRKTEPQISHPPVAPSVPSQERRASSDFDDVFIALLQERDNRPADLRRMFDEYHVTLLSDDSDLSDDL